MYCIFWLQTQIRCWRNKYRNYCFYKGWITQATLPHEVKICALIRGVNHFRNLGSLFRNLFRISESLNLWIWRINRVFIRLELNWNIKTIFQYAVSNLNIVNKMWLKVAYQLDFYYLNLRLRAKQSSGS